MEHLRLIGRIQAEKSMEQFVHFLTFYFWPKLSSGQMVCFHLIINLLGSIILMCVTYLTIVAFY